MSKPGNSKITPRNGGTFYLQFSENRGSIAREQLLQEGETGQLEFCRTGALPTDSAPGTRQSTPVRSGAAAVVIFTVPAASSTERPATD